MQVQRLALLSLLAVFQDILPAYRIRPPTEKELQVRVQGFGVALHVMHSSLRFSGLV